jgi:hypothetical protein
MNVLFVHHHVRGTANVTSIAVVVMQFIGGEAAWKAVQ